MKATRCLWCNRHPTIRVERTWLGLFGVVECKSGCIAPSISAKGDTAAEAMETARRLWDDSNRVLEVKHA